MNDIPKKKVKSKYDDLSSIFNEEKDTGNVEYKLYLTERDENRIEHLLTQMNYRLYEGNGECIYVIGITDCGTPVGLTTEEYVAAKEILIKVCEKGNFAMNELSKKETNENKFVYEFLIREKNRKYIDIKIGITGNVDSGKSTTLGVLISGENDNGNGKARLNVFNFRHEIDTGRTSSVAQHILGFNDKGEIVNYGLHRRIKNWGDIVKNSSKIISLFDLCGHLKYLRTTIRGLTLNNPDLNIILVGGNMGVGKMTREHIFLSVILKIPFIILITKMDLREGREEVFTKTIDEIKKILNLAGLRRISFDVKTDDDVIMAYQNIHSNVVPIFYISNKTGMGLNYLRTFLNIFNVKKENLSHLPVEFFVDSVFQQVPNVGLVVGGQLVKGKVKVGDKLLLGPNNNTYESVIIKSIHRKKLLVPEVESGSYVCFAFKKNDIKIHKNNVLISEEIKERQVWIFEASIYVMKAHSTTIKVGYQPIINVSNIRQACEVLKITKNGENVENLQTGDEATIRFKFIHHSEYVKKEMLFVLTEEQTKMFGTITKCEYEK